MTAPLDRMRWSPEEDALLSRLRGAGLSYGEISEKHLPHRSVRALELRAIGALEESFANEKVELKRLADANRQFVAAINALRHKVAISHMERRA